jgi:3-hydroxyisobutyrate dehydrogenase-like beta-hydroxyacid dehydrogenase
MSTIAWIGLGHMGHPMSQHMRKAGYVVRGVDIDPAAAKRARRDGIEVVDTVAEACKGVDAVFTMLPAGPDVKKVLTGPGGVFASVPAKAVVVDCSTIVSNMRWRSIKQRTRLGARSWKPRFQVELKALLPEHSRLCWAARRNIKIG